MERHIAIEARNISKLYRLGLINHGMLYRDLQSWVARLRGKDDPNATVNKLSGGFRHGAQHLSGERFRALDDLSFDIRRGEIVGVIGRNGAGKSTLLKILSRITTPTSGLARVRGRVASLLEVGTGFHPELTGRENVFLNGAILGMSRPEIERKFDEIVAFSEVEDFIDTPVKRYSSGMHVRLAFSVAAHLDADILIVDEVLSVGDAKFQKKCLGKIGDITQDGRTVLFVSHNMGAITSLCSRCLVLEEGRLVFDGSPSDAVIRYHTSGALSPAVFDAGKISRLVGDGQARLVHGSVLNERGEVASEFEMAEAIRVQMRYRLLEPSTDISVPNFHFLLADGSYAFCGAPSGVRSNVPGEYIVSCRIPGGLLNEGTYFVGLAVTSYAGAGHHVNFWEQGALCFHVREDLERTADYRYGFTGPIPGAVRPDLEWSLRNAGAKHD